MSDILERLQHHSQRAVDVEHLEPTYLHEVFGRAADEIERLTADRLIAVLEAEAACYLADKYHDIIRDQRKRITKLEAVIRQVRSNMNKRAVDNFDYAGGEYAINGDTINMLVLDIAERDERIAELEAELEEWKDACDPGVDTEGGNDSE